MAYQHLASQNTWVSWWSDPFHKAARKTALAIRLAGCEPFVKSVMKLSRFTRGPFKSSKFGQLISDARSHILRVLRTGKDHDMVTPWLTGMARDCESPLRSSDFPAENFDHAVAYSLLKAEEGRQPVHESEVSLGPNFCPRFCEAACT